MGKIYVGQTKLRLTVETKADLTGATAHVIKYIKPDSTAGSFTAVCDDLPGGEIYYDFLLGDLDVSGPWTFWAYVTFTTDVIPGESFKINVHNEGE